MSFIATIHEHRFVMTDAQQSRLREEVVAAIDAGGGFVDFEHEEGTAAVFVTAMTPLLLQRVPEVEAIAVVPDPVEPSDEQLAPTSGQITPFVRRKTQ
jgi:hypothetical protein